MCVQYRPKPKIGRLPLAAPKECSLELEVANTSIERVRGLSGRKSLVASKGMLFVFDHIGVHCIWMKDMRFAIDILWLNSGGKVTKLEENVTPGTYPLKFCGENTLFVIELRASMAKSLGYNVGSKIDL